MNEFKYKVLEIIKFKDKFVRPTCDLEKLAGTTAVIADRRYYGQPCYSFAGVEELGFVAESAIEGLVDTDHNPAADKLKEEAPSIDVRENTNKVLEMAEEGLISWQDLALMALKWMSEYEVSSMLQANEVFLDDEDEDE